MVKQNIITNGTRNETPTAFSSSRNASEDLLGNDSAEVSATQAKPPVTGLAAIQTELDALQDKEGLLNQYNQIHLAKKKADADFAAARKDYAAQVENGDLQSDLNTFESQKVTIYQKITALPPTEWVTNPELMEFVQEVSSQYKGKEDLLAKASKPRELATQLNERQKELFEKLFLEFFQSNTTPVSNDFIMNKVALTLCCGDKDNFDAKGTEWFPTYSGEKKLYEMLLADRDFFTMCGTLARAGKIKSEYVQSGKGRKPVYSTLQATPVEDFNTLDDTEVDLEEDPMVTF